jgi:hypothetical protein
MNHLTIKKIAQVAFNAGKTGSNIQTFFKSYKKDERLFYIKNEIPIVKILWKLINKKDEQLKNAELLKESKEIKISVKKLIAYKTKANKIAMCFNAGYSMGGRINVCVKKGTKIVFDYQKNDKGNFDYTKEQIKKVITNTLRIGTYSNATEYSRGCKYSATHSSHTIFLTPDELDNIEIVGGIPTQKLENKKISNCFRWVGCGHKQTYYITKIKTFITSDFHSSSFNECEIWRKKMAVQLLKNRHELISIADKLKAAQGRFIGLEDSLKAGNCKGGTEAFAQRNNLNIDYGYNLGYLLRIEPNNKFLLRLL